VYVTLNDHLICHESNFLRAHYTHFYDNVVLFCVCIIDINYFHCLEIMHLLKLTEDNHRNIFGTYSSQRLKVRFDFFYFSCMLGQSVLLLFLLAIML